MCIPAQSQFAPFESNSNTLCLNYNYIGVQQSFLTDLLALYFYWHGLLLHLASPSTIHLYGAGITLKLDFCISDKPPGSHSSFIGTCTLISNFVVHGIIVCHIWRRFDENGRK